MIRHADQSSSPRALRIRRAFVVACNVALAAFATALSAANDLSLSQKPLYVSPTTTPNVLFTVDDSGSLSKTIDENYASCLLLPPPYPQYPPGHLGIVSWEYNPLAYNPSITYEVPPNVNGSARQPPSFTHAPSNGFKPTPWPYHYLPQYVDLTKDYRPVDGWAACDTFLKKRAYYAVRQGAGFVEVPIPPAQEQNFANWYSFYRSREMALKAAMMITAQELDLGSARVAWQGLNLGRTRTTYIEQSTASADVGDIKRYNLARRQEFLRWLVDVHSAGNSLTGSTPIINAVMRAGAFFSRPVGSGGNVVLPGESGSEAECRANYNIVVTDGTWNFENGPNYWTSDDDNQSWTLPPTDRAEVIPGLQSYTPGTPDTKVFTNPSGQTLSDLMFHYWATDLLPGVVNRVPPRMTDMSTSPSMPAWNPANDPASWQHMVNYAVTYAIPPVFPDVNSATDLVNLRTGAIAWPPVVRPPNSTGNYEPSNGISDLWHGTLNSRGQTISTNQAGEIIAALRAILKQIGSVVAQTGAVSLPTGQVGNGSVAYTTHLTASDWTGDLVARATNANGSLGATLWSASCRLTGNCGNGSADPPPASRTILTSTQAAGTGVAFRLSNLSSATVTEFDTNPNTALVDGNAGERVDWIRGVRNEEQQNGGALRNRSGVLGAIVDSQTLVVGPPMSAYPDLWPGSAAENTPANVYSKFVTQQQSRQTMIYVGTDDGMMHAFDDAGLERFAYIPRGILSKLPAITHPSYTATALVRAQPVARDVFSGGSWRTMLVSGLGAGGKGLFALDVTNPVGVTESNGNVVADLTEGNDDLGHIYTPPFIARLADGNWWALSGNGYNSVNGNAALFMLNLSTGATQVISVGGLSDPTGNGRKNGLSGVVVSDADRDGIAEHAFAGDLFGNLWKFDLTAASSAQWAVAPSPGTPLFKALDKNSYPQPITSTPRLVRARASNRMVLVFGTGKLLEDSDKIKGAYDKQSIYGLFDVTANIGPIARGNLQPRSLATGSDVGNYKTREIVGTNHANGTKGWVIDLSKDESVTTAATPRGSAILVPTLDLTSGDSCGSKLSGWLLSIDPETGRTPSTVDELGGRSAAALFDLDGDGAVTGADLGTNTNGVAGIRIDGPILGATLGTSVGSAARPGPAPDCDFWLVASTSGTMPVASTCFAPRRVGWRQITPEKR